MEPPALELLKDAIIQAIVNCTDPNILDLLKQLLCLQ